MTDNIGRLNELLAAGDWASSLELVQRSEIQTSTMSKTIADWARDAGLRKIEAQALAMYVRNSPSPEESICTQAILTTYENGLLSLSALVGAIGVRLYRDNPVLRAYSSLSNALLEGDLENLAVLRKALIEFPDQYGSFYAGYEEVMFRRGAIAAAIEDLEQATLKLETLNPSGTACRSSKISLIRMLRVAGHVHRMVALAFEMLDQDVPDLHGELLQLLATALVADGNTVVDHPPTEDVGRFLSDLLHGRTSLGKVPTLSELAAFVFCDFQFVDLSARDFPYSSHNISSDFVSIANDGPKSIAKALRRYERVRPWHDEPTLSDRVKDVLDTVENGRKKILSPYTGSTVYTEHMIDEECFVFKDKDRVGLATQWTETEYAFADTTYILLDEKIVLFSENAGIEPRYLACSLFKLLRKIVSRRDDVVIHLQRSNKEVGVAEFLVPHVGHYIWNSISAWEPFFKYGGNDKADLYVVRDNFRTLGGVDVLYAADIGPSKEIILSSDEADIQSTILDRKAMVLTLKNNYISAELAPRVSAWARSRLEPNHLDKLQKLRAEFSPMILVTIRLDNRSWVDQEEGWPRLFEALNERYPRACFILDGVNGNVTQGWTHASMSVDDEFLLAERIIKRCPTLQIYNSIGCSIEESCILAELSDFYIAPVGAGMAKYRWITNLPGVAFSNESFSKPDSEHGRLYDHYRDDAIKALHVDQSAVKDVAEGNTSGGRANFTMDWHELLPLASELCERKALSL